MVRQVFVARERELAQLESFLWRALAAQGSVCFVTGEAGSGKTALVTEFARRAQGQIADLAVAVGQSDAHTGAGDAYLPFREVLGQLTGDVEAKLAQGAITEENASRLQKLVFLSCQALVDVGPDLIGVFVPGAGLAARVGAFAVEKVGWLDKLEKLVGGQREGVRRGASGIEQSHIFEQYANVLARLSDKHPLLLVLDDLQWADAASIGLLFRLARCIGQHRILLVGTYRPEEVAIGRAGERHPLEKPLAEIKRYYGDMWVDLERMEEVEGRRFVDAFLETEPNRLGEGFRQRLYQHTGGHPLFTVELLRTMQERGDLIQDGEGQWVETAVLDWESLPTRVEGVIEERIGRLEGELLQALTVGSVEGEDFTAEVVARVQAAEARDLVRRLSGELERQHRLVRGRGVWQLEPGGQRLSLYRFQHNLFQRYLYGELGEAERTYLHEDVGNALEELYGDHANEIAVQLARHFDEAGKADKAVLYLAQAGEQAAARFANDEAIAHFSRALELIPSHEAAERAAERYALLLAREEVYDLRGQREVQALDLAALQALTATMDDDARRCEVTLRKASYNRTIGDPVGASEAARTAISLAKSAHDLGQEAHGHLLCAEALCYQGSFEQSCIEAEEGLLAARASQRRDMEAQCLHSLATVLFYQGDFDRSDACEREAVTLFRELDRHREIIPSLNNLAGAAAAKGHFEEARTYCEQALASSRRVGDRRGEAVLLGNLGGLSLIQGDYASADRFLEQALPLYTDIADRRGMGDVLAHKGLVSHYLGDHEAAASFSQHALSIAREIGNRITEAYALMNLGHAQTALGSLVDAAMSYERSLAILEELGQAGEATEALAGLAGASLAGGNPSQAMFHVERILEHLESRTLDGASDPGRVYLACYHTLRSLDDPRAGEVLAAAYNLLQERAAKIGDEEMRRLYLENVPANREIVEEWAKSG